jgi:hypothetical protein
VTGLERTMRALSGAVLTPPACGATFVPPEALPGSAPGADPASALARAYADAKLDFAFVPSWEPWARDLALNLRAADVAVLWAVPGVFTPALASAGHSAGLRAIGRTPGALTPALEAAQTAMLRAIADGVANKADAIVVADDLAGASGPLASPEYLVANVLPRLARAAAAARAAGRPAVLHSDGDVTAMLRAVSRAGFAAMHLAGVGDEALGRLFGQARSAGLAVIGGLGARTLAHGLVGGVRTGTRLAVLARSGPLLVADDGGITTPKEFAALLAAISAAKGRL